MDVQDLKPCSIIQELLEQYRARAFKPLIERARVNAEAAGVSDLVKYEALNPR